MVFEKLVLDAAPLLSQTREELLAKSTNLYTTPAVYSEIKDESARQRLELLKDNLTVVQPSPESVKFVTEFSKKTGDFTVLSSPDIGIIALTYELCPDKTALNSAPQVFESNMQVVEHNSAPAEEQEEAPVEDDGFTVVAKPKRGRRFQPNREPRVQKEHKEQEEPKEEPKQQLKQESKQEEAQVEAQEHAQEETQESEPVEDAGESDSESDNPDDWITPENLEEKLMRDKADVAPITESESYPVALASNDFAVQNVTLQIGLEAIGSTGMRIRQLKTYMQRCHACFKLISLAKDAPTRQFCPRCGGHTLTRVTVSVKDGKLHLHLKANMQWKTRGDRYTLPKPQSQRARRERHDTKVEFYTEDQPEYQKAVKTQNWERRRNQRVVDTWIGPGTVEGADSPFVDGRRQVSKVRIGRGRNANAK